MKPAAFRYVVPSSLDEAVQARAAAEDSVVLAGGQSLIPTMNFRLANPEVLIDLRRVPGLGSVRVEDGWVRVGAMCRQRDLERSADVVAANPLIHETLQNVAHPAIRNRGTVGGSLAHADPSAELPTLLTALRGEVVSQGPDGRRTIAASDFFEFIFTTALEPGELLVESAFPVLDKGEGWAFLEFARRHGDYAVAGVAATLLLSPDGTIARARLAACGISSTPVLLADCEELLTGQRPDPSLFERAGDLARAAVTVADDTTTSRAYREHVLSGIVRACLTKALQRTGELS